jgi:hypothetical protein
MMAEGDQPGQKRIPDALYPEWGVERDPICGVVKIRRIEGKTVEELAVVAVPREDGKARWDPGRVGKGSLGHHEAARVAFAGNEQADDDESDRCNQRDTCSGNRVIGERPYSRGRSDRLRLVRRRRLGSRDCTGSGRRRARGLLTSRTSRWTDD